jgi:hypothetical protein
VPEPRQRRTFEGGLFRELPERTGLDRHHLLSRESLKVVELKLGSKLDPDFGPAILMEPGDHRLLFSADRLQTGQRWRAGTAKLLLDGKWDEALEREIGDVERVAPGKYTARLNEARDHGRALWPERRHDQLRLELEGKPQKRWSPMDPPPGWRPPVRDDPKTDDRSSPDSGTRLPPPTRGPDRDRGIG